MTNLLAWGLQKAREQTLRLATDLPAHRACDQAAPGEHHPTWILGHLLLGDAYLLSLIGAAGLPADFEALLGRYGPDGPPRPSPGDYDPFDSLVERLAATGERRRAAVAAMPAAELARPTPDPVLARAQPTIGHHLQALICHEGYHSGQLATWRRSHDLAAVPWAFAAPVP